jgi:SSS family solute:Na+ symporter
MVLSPLAAAFFTLALLATVMSTLDSYLFIAATTVGHDFASRDATAQTQRRRTRIGLALSAAIAAGGALLFDSAVQVWHDVGSVITATLLMPVLAIHLPRRWRPSGRIAIIAMILAAAISIAWILAPADDGYPLGLEPMLPALAAAALVLGIGVFSRRESIP